MKLLVSRGLVAPAIVALATLVTWAIAGTGWALAILAIGATAVIGFHLYHLELLSEWASGPLDGPVPVGRGSWAPTFGAIYRQVRTRASYMRVLRHVIARLHKDGEEIPVVIIEWE